MTDREYYEEALLNMMSNKKLVHLSFYSFILAKCEVSFDNRIDTLGVSFQGVNYKLIIGRKFKEWSIDERIAVLIHETRHIMGLHVFRKGDRNHRLFNIACDIAINQTIVNLPKGIVDPKTGEQVGGALFPKTFKFPENLDAENYYELLKQKKEEQEKEKKEQEGDDPDDCESCGGSGEQEKDDSGESGDSEPGESGDSEPCESCNGSGKEPGGYTPSDGTPNLTSPKEITIDVHDWSAVDENGDPVEVNEELAKSITQSMVKDAMEQTTKNRGTLPGDLEDILTLLRRKPVISWKKQLRRYLSSKSGKKIETIKRKNRRFPHRADLRGKKRHTDKRVITVCVDTSGSMLDSEIVDALVEINEITKVNGMPLQLIQVDTKIQGMIEFDGKSKTFKRNGYGGTYMATGVEYLMDNKIKSDVVIYLSDMFIEDVSNDSIWSKWNKEKTPVLWLSTSGTIPEWHGYKRHEVIDINRR